MEGFSEQMTFILRLDEYKEARHMKSQGRDAQKDGTVSIKTLRGKVTLNELERCVGSKLC